MAILALMVLGGFSMCSKNEVVAHEEDPWIDLCGDTPILFASRTNTPVTKATTPLPSGTHFAVFGFYQPGDIEEHEPGTWLPFPITHTPNFMYNQEVEYEYDDELDRETYTYTPIKYWPNNAENTLTFWGYSPYTPQPAAPATPNPMLLQVSDGERYTNQSTGIPNIKFTVTDGRTDLLISDIEDDQTYRGGDPATGVVTLHFQHILSRIDFVVKIHEDAPDGSSILLSTIKLVDVYKTATHNQDDDWLPLSYDDETKGDLVLFSSPGGIPLDKETSPEELTDFMVLPQAFGPGAKLQIVYDDGEEATGEVLLAGLHDGEWQKGKRYTYTVSIMTYGNPIIFSASVAPWDEDDGYVNIIK